MKTAPDSQPVPAGYTELLAELAGVLRCANTG